MTLRSSTLAAFRARPLVIAAGLTALFASAAPALAQTPSPADEQYRQALYQRETGEPYTAIETLESLLSANPTLNRARMELAVAY
jgi:hypothetical protein